MNYCECIKECKCDTFQVGECDYCEERKCKYCEENTKINECDHWGNMKGKEKKKEKMKVKKPMSMCKMEEGKPTMKAVKKIGQ